MEAWIVKSYKFTKSPSYLLLIVILVNMLFGLAYITILIVEDEFHIFGSWTILNLLNHTVLLIVMMIIQQIIYFIMIWRRYTESYTVSTNEIKHKKWIFIKDKQEYSLKNMISMDIHKSFWGNILNYWNITISYVGSTSAINKNEIFKVVIERVSNPEYLISLMKEKL